VEQGDGFHFPLSLPNRPLNSTFATHLTDLLAGHQICTEAVYTHPELGIGKFRLPNGTHRLCSLCLGFSGSRFRTECITLGLDFGSAKGERPWNSPCSVASHSRLSMVRAKRTGPQKSRSKSAGSRTVYVFAHIIMGTCF